MSRCGDCKLGCYGQGAFYCEENLGYEQCIDRLQDALYAVDRLQGEWIRDGHHIRCKKCGAYFCDTDREGDAYPQNFCPNCGARMKGASDALQN